MKSKDIEITAIAARQMCHSIITDEDYSSTYYVDRHHLKLISDMEALSVKVYVANPEYNSSKLSFETKKRQFKLMLCRGTETISSVQIEMDFLQCEENIYGIADIPLRSTDVECYRDYELKIVPKRGRKPIETFTVKFFPEDMCPDEMISRLSGCLVAQGREMRNCDVFSRSSKLLPFRFCLELDCKLSAQDAEVLPEIMADLYLDGHTITYPTTVRFCPADFLEKDKLIVEGELDFEDLTDIDNFYLSISMLETRLAGIVFSIKEDEEGCYTGSALTPMRYPDQEEIDELIEQRRQLRKAMEEEERAERQEVQEAAEKLNDMVGLANVKRKVQEYASLMRFHQYRKSEGLPTALPPLHAMFFGSPGTGKTTVAKIMGKLMKKAGVLSKGHVVVRERSTLCGTCYGSEAEKTLAALEEAKGGILLIDEAYQLHQPQDARDPGHFVMDALLTALADEGNRDWMLILAGYTEPMKKMLKMNPGIASRIPQSNHYLFDDYQPEELLEIAERKLETSGFVMTEEADKALKATISADFENRGDDFGNARYVMNAIETQIIPAMACRVASIEQPTKDDLMLVKASDIPAPMKTDQPQRKRLGF